MIFLFVFLLGSILGSFLNVCIYRLPKKESILSPPSHCPHCGEPIRFYDNIPILSYLLLGGKCRHCKEHISLRYPVVEGLSGLLSLALFIKYSLTAQFLLLLLFAAALIIITFIDLDYQIIPDIISIPGIFLGIGASFFIPIMSWFESLFGILIGGGFLLLVAIGYKWLTGREGMGGGDIKLLAMVGAWLGWKAIPFILFSSSLIGVLIGGGTGLMKKRGLRSRIPFGPFLSISSIIYIFFGPEIISWYIAL
ncbi:MAG: prepilin peptidase [Deltaproteobacteria bacterium]|nr:MAG: prepilin peptidase [Deltaproteobacteria bacterium]